MARITRPAYTDYQEALDNFSNIRKEMNDYIANDDVEKIKIMFDGLKYYAANEESVAMDVLAYYYKSGIKGVVPENYLRYIEWEILSASRGNELAIEKLQFLIGYACDTIMEDNEFDLIEYKNDIDDSNVLYVLGKNLCKILAREFLKAFPVDLVQLPDEASPYTQEAFVNLRKMIDEAIPKTIAFLKS